jgi:DNA polymerase III subunit delta'
VLVYDRMMPWNTLGHEWAVAMLARAAQTQPAHAYLFTGPAHIGKMTLAYDFARALNCEGDDPPCGVCRACVQIGASRHPDFHLVQRQPDKSEILLEQLRELQNDLTYKPYEARWRVAVIENAQEANASAANSFLKTLEEPAPQVVIVLTAPNPEAVIPTIRSRCQIMPLRALPLGQVEQALRDVFHVAPEAAQLLSRLSVGRIGWAISASQDGEVLTLRSARLQEMLGLLPQSRAARIELAGRLTRAENELGPLLELWLSWWRDLLLVKGGCAEAIVNVDLRERLCHDAESLELSAIRKTIEAIQSARRQIGQNVNARLALEVMLIETPTLARP